MKRLEDAESILDAELEALESCAKISREVNSGWHIISGYIFWVGILVIGMLLNHAWISWDMATISFWAWFVVYFLSALPAVTRSVRTFLYLRRLQRNLGLHRIGWFVGWKEFGIRLSRMLPGYLGMTACGVSIFYRDSHAWIVDVGLVSLTLGFVVTMRLISNRSLVPIQKAMEQNERLRLTLVSGQESYSGLASDQLISIPEIEYKQIAGIERALVFIDRQQTIEESLKTSNTSVWAVRQSANTMKKKLVLEPPVLLRVQTRIYDLSTTPRPMDARRDANGIWRVPVPETSYEILYTVAEDSHCIMVQDLFEKSDLKRQDLEGSSA